MGKNYLLDGVQVLLVRTVWTVLLPMIQILLQFFITFKKAALRLR